MTFIGIDPDVKKCGFAILGDNYFSAYPLAFWDLIAQLQNYVKQREDVKVFLEAGWLNKKSNWHGGNFAVAQKIARAVGENHQTGKLIEEFLKENCIDYELIRPSRSKTSPEQFKRLTNIDIRNQDVVDAAMLVWGRKF